MVFSRSLRTFLVYAGLATLVLIALYLGSRPQGIHLTRAQLLVQYTQGYPPPSRTADWRALPGRWQDVALPLSLIHI